MDGFRQGHDFDRNDNPVTNSRNRFNIARRVGRVAKGRAEFFHRSVQPLLEVDKGFGFPQRLPQRFARNHVAALLQQ